MRITRREWIEKVKRLVETSPLGTTWEAVADFAEEHGGPFEPEPQEIWRGGDVANFEGVKLTSDGRWWRQEPPNPSCPSGWRPNTQPPGPVLIELARRLLAEWRARQGERDWADAAVAEWEGGEVIYSQESRQELAAIIRRHGGTCRNDSAIARIRQIGRSEGSMSERQRVVAWLKQQAQGKLLASAADAIERGEHLK